MTKVRLPTECASPSGTDVSVGGVCVKSTASGYRAPPVYTCGYSDYPEDVGEDGCFPVPDGPGLGVTYDWDLIQRSRTAHHVFE
jgi:hypothetical protein